MKLYDLLLYYYIVLVIVLLALAIYCGVKLWLDLIDLNNKYDALLSHYYIVTYNENEHVVVVLYNNYSIAYIGTYYKTVSSNDKPLTSSGIIIYDKYVEAVFNYLYKIKLEADLYYTWSSIFFGLTVLSMFMAIFTDAIRDEIR